MARQRTGVLYSVRDNLDLVRLAEQQGYDSVWSAEGQGRTAFGKLERWATVTDRIELSTGIVNVFSRTPAAVAQAAATLDTHSGGRVNLGLGVAHPGVVEEFHGADFERPLTRMAEYITLVRRYLAGDGEPFEGQFFSPGRTSFWKAWEPLRSEIPIYNAALGEGNVRLTGKYADGWLPNLYPLDKFERALDWLAEGAAEADRDVDDIDIAMYLLCAVDDDPDRAHRAAAQHIAYYLRDIPGYYGRVAEEAGYSDNVEAVKEAPSLDAAADVLDREFVDTIAVAGTPEQARARLDDYREAGVDMPVVRGPTYGVGANEAFIEQTVRALAPEQ
jgi:alkanesulfonate monooxygenase SsuD/methylene tetrahydromethanopterin reductase-like flavin-dependent oxidoreductase (luciferase family)